MKQLFEDQDLTGKTIKKAEFIQDDKFFLLFDQSFCILKCVGWDDRVMEIDNEDYSLTPNAYNCKELFQLGLIDEKTKNEIVKAYQNKNDNLIKEKELKKLAELRKKYPDLD